MMYIEDVIRILKTDYDCNFLAMAITPYHAVGVDAAIMCLKEMGITPKGYVLMVSHPNSGRVINKSYFSMHLLSIEHIDFEYKFKNKKTLIEQTKVKFDELHISIKKDNKKGRKIYFVWTEIANNLLHVIWQSRPEDNLVFIKIDDGAASYLSPFECRLSYFLYEAKTNIFKQFKGYIKAGLYAISTNICQNALLKKGYFINANVFLSRSKYTDNSLKRNDIIVQHYVQAFKNIDTGSADFSDFGNAIIINSQGLVESNVTNGNVDYEAYRKLSLLLKKLGENVILKPHPREQNLDKYNELGWKVASAKVSQEVILAKLTCKPKCIISIFSSTLLNAKGLFDIPVMSLARILLQEKISERFRLELERYIRMYDGIVFFPTDYNEIKEMIVRM